MGLKDLMVSFILVGVLILLAVTFAYDFQTANDSETLITNDNSTLALKTDVGVSLANYTGEAQEINDIYYNTTLKEGTDSLYVPSQNTIITKSWKTPFAIVKKAISYSYANISGNRGEEFSYVFYSVIAMISIVAIFFFIRFIRSGQE